MVAIVAVRKEMGMEAGRRRGADKIARIAEVDTVLVKSDVQGAGTVPGYEIAEVPET